MFVKRCKIGPRLYNVITMDMYISCIDAYPTYDTAIEYGEYILPLLTQSEINKTGMVYCGMVFEIRESYPGDLSNYHYSRLEVIDLSNSGDVIEYMRRQERIAQINKDILENPDSIFRSYRNPEDVPEMRLFKDAMDAKQMDIDKYIPIYENITGSKFNNDKRLLYGSEMTIKKMKGFADAFDLKLTLTIEDANPNVPNPIGKPISIVINRGNE